MNPLDIFAPIGNALTGYSESRNADALFKRQLAQQDQDKAESLEEKSARMTLLRAQAEHALQLANPHIAAKAKQDEIDRRSDQILKWADENKVPLTPVQRFYVKINGDLPPEVLKPAPAAKTPTVKPFGAGNFGYQIDTPEGPQIVNVPPPKGWKSPEERAAGLIDTKEREKRKQRAEAVKDLNWPSYMKQRYVATGQKPANVPQQMLADARGNELALEDASKIMMDIKELEKNSTNPNGFGSWTGDRFANAQYRAGFSPGGVYRDLASRLSRFSIKAMSSGAMGKRITVPVIKLLTPHLPDLSIDTASNIRDKMVTIISDLANNQSELKTQMESFYGQELPMILPGAKELMGGESELQPGEEVEK
jgi:hypothetical protein